MPFGTIKLNDGKEIPAIAYGSGSVMKGKDVSAYVEQALDTGFSHIDTAAYYANEDSVGKGIRESGLEREDIYVTTKYATGDVLEGFHTSLSKLGLKYVDLYLIHNPAGIPKGGLGKVWEGFETIKKQGLAKSIGVSNFGVKHLEELLTLATTKPVVNQIMFHLYNYHEQKPILEYCSKHGIVVEAYSSLAPITRYPNGPATKLVENIAKKRGITPTQVHLLWVRSKGIVIVTTSTKREHLQEYLDTGDLESLSEEDIASLDQAAEDFHRSKSLKYSVAKYALLVVLGVGAMTWSGHLSTLFLR